MQTDILIRIIEGIVIYVGLMMAIVTVLFPKQGDDDPS